MRIVRWMAILGALGCDDTPTPAPRTTLGTVSVDSARPTPPTPSAQRTARGRAGPARRNARSCRAVSVQGRVASTDGKPIIKHTPLDDASWLQVDPGASVTVKHARTAREVTIEGPAQVLPCYEGGETFLLSRGVLETIAGPGARPGSEVFVATPHGVVRSADATMSVRVEKGLSVTVRAGKAWLDRPGGPPAITVAPSSPASVSGTVPDVKDSLTACDAAARKSQAMGLALLEDRADAGTLGQRAGRHFRARQAARKACGIAAAVIGRMEGGAERQAALRRLEGAQAGWQRSPSKPQVVE